MTEPDRNSRGQELERTETWPYARVKGENTDTPTSPEARSDIRVQDLWDQACVLIGDREAKYGVVAVLNPGEGPDEQRLAVTRIAWDHEYGALRLEIEN